MGADRPRLSRGDLLFDALGVVRAKPGRALALGLAVALGVATFVGISTLSAAANRRTAERIDALRPELVRVVPAEGPDPGGLLRAETLGTHPAVRAAVVVDSYGPVAIQARTTAPSEQATLVGVDGALVSATRSVIRGSELPAGGSVAAGAHVALVGVGVAERLQLADVAAAPAVWVAGVPFTVIGVIDDSEHLADLIDSVVVPRDVASQLGGTLEFSTGYVRTDRGLATDVADAVPLQLTPESPEVWSVEVPRVPIDVTEGISGDLRRLTLAMSGLVMAIGVVAIANAMMRSVYERTPEIGLRRALGARTSHIVAMVVLEATLVGAAAGLVGIAVGSAVAASVSLRNGWPMVVDGQALCMAVGAATAAGVVAGLLPGLRAVKITPSQALRRD